MRGSDREKHGKYKVLFLREKEKEKKKKASDTSRLVESFRLVPLAGSCHRDRDRMTRIDYTWTCNFRRKSMFVIGWTWCRDVDLEKTSTRIGSPWFKAFVRLLFSGPLRTNGEEIC